jgi:hypothetical protein
MPNILFVKINCFPDREETLPNCPLADHKTRISLPRAKIAFEKYIYPQPLVHQLIKILFKRPLITFEPFELN